MNARLRGKVIEAYPNRLVVDVQGVGYEVIVPLSTFDRLHAAEGLDVDLRTHLHFGTANQPGQKLFGFATEEERDVFLMLIERVSGIGPSVAMAVLSGMPVTRSMSIRKTSRSSSVAKPNNFWPGWLAVPKCRWVRKSTCMPSAARRWSKVESGTITS